MLSSYSIQTFIWPQNLQLHTGQIIQQLLLFFLITPKRVAEDYTKTGQVEKKGGYGWGPPECYAKSLQSCQTLRPFGLQPTRLLCPWDSPGKTTAVGCHILLLGIFPTKSASNILFLGLNGGYLEVSLLNRTYTLGTFLNMPNKEEEKLRILPNVVAFRNSRQSRFELFRVRSFRLHHKLKSLWDNSVRAVTSETKGSKSSSKVQPNPVILKDRALKSRQGLPPSSPGQTYCLHNHNCSSNQVCGGHQYTELEQRRTKNCHVHTHTLKYTHMCTPQTLTGKGEQHSPLQTPNTAGKREEERALSKPFPTRRCLGLWLFQNPFLQGHSVSWH